MVLPVCRMVDGGTMNHYVGSGLHLRASARPVRGMFLSPTSPRPLAYSYTSRCLVMTVFFSLSGSDSTASRTSSSRAIP